VVCIVKHKGALSETPGRKTTLCVTENPYDVAFITRSRGCECDNLLFVFCSSTTTIMIFNRIKVLKIHAKVKMCVLQAFNNFS